MNGALSIREPLLRWVKQQTGLHITSVNQGPLLLALKVLATESGDSQDGYAASLIDGRIDPQPFFDAVTTHESFFLRHRRHMEVAIERVIQPLLQKGVRPRILSAPCAQGEEPYSFAMLLQDYGINPDRVEIVGVDIAASSIEQAKRGTYRRYSLRQVPESFIVQHFQPRSGDLFQVHPVPMRAVQFHRMNLLTESLARLVPGFHLIFSHNMLIYFDRATTSRMLELFGQLLDSDGRLFVDTTEVPHVAGDFEGLTLNGVRAFRKHGGGVKKASPYTSPVPMARFSTDVAPQFPPVPQHKTIAPHVDRNSQRESATTGRKRATVDVSSKRRSAEQAYQNKQFEEAILLYDQLIEQHPLWASWARLGKARVLMDSGEEMEALEVAEAAISAKKMVVGIYLTQKDEADAHAIIALIMHNKGLSGKVEEHLKQVRILNSKHEILKLLR